MHRLIWVFVVSILTQPFLHNVAVKIKKDRDEVQDGVCSRESSVCSYQGLSCSRGLVEETYLVIILG